MQVEVFAGDATDWNGFTARNGGGILQSYEWGRFRSEPSLKWNLQRLRVKEHDSIRLSALVLEKPLPGGFSFYYCPEGPVVKGNDWSDQSNQTAFTALTEYLLRHKGSRVLFLKVDPHVPAGDFPVEWLDGQGFRDSPEDIQAAVVAHVDLAGEEDDVISRMKQKGRYNIRYAAKKGVTVRSGTDERDLAAFYMLMAQTAKRQGISYRSHQYFSLFRKHFMVEADLARFVIAEYEGKPVAAILVTFVGNEAVYLYGGSSPQDRHVFGSYAVQWEGIREAKRRGCAYYNLTGVAATDDPNDTWAGLRQFKLKFGAEVIHLVGARDQPYQPFWYTAFTNTDRVRRRVVKLLGRARTQ